MSSSKFVTSRASAFDRPVRTTSRAGSHYKYFQHPKLLPSVQASDLMGISDCFRIPDKYVSSRNFV